MAADPLADLAPPVQQVAAPTQTTNESVDVLSDLAPPPKEDQHAIVNDAVEKKRLWDRAFDQSLSPEQRSESAKKVFSIMLDSVGNHITEETRKTVEKSWEDLNHPLVSLPRAGEPTPEEAKKYPLQPYISGAYNAAAGVAEGLTTPLNIGTLGTFGALMKAAQGVGIAANAARHALTLLKTGFAIEMTKGAAESAGAASVPDGKTTQEQTKDVVSTILQGGMATVAATHAAGDVMEPSTRGKATNPHAVEDAILRKTDENIAKADEASTPSRNFPITDQPEGASNANPITSPAQEIRGGPETPPAGSEMAGGKPGGPVEVAGESVKAPPAEVPKEIADLKPPGNGPVEIRDLQPPSGPTGLRNSITDQEREARGLPPVVEPARHEFGSTWDEASKLIDENPNAGIDLVTELRKKPRPITDTENALLLHRQIDLQNQFDRTAERLINGDEGYTAETRAADSAKLAVLSDDLLDIYDVGKKTGTEQGRGLAARKILANEDYSLSGMVTKRRAANDGRKLSEPQMKQIEDLHAKIEATQKAFDDYVERTNERMAKMEKTRPGTRNTDRNVVSKYISEQADAARQRIKERLTGERSSTIGADMIADYAIIAADHLSRGLEAGAELVKEFGDTIKPHLNDIIEKARAHLDEWGADVEGKPDGKMTPEQRRLSSYKARARTRAQDYKDRLASGDLGPKPKPAPLVLDAEGEALKAEAQRAKDAFQVALIEDRLSNRTTPEKAQDTLVKWRRGFLLSSANVLVKLTAAATNRLVQSPIEEAIGGVIGKMIPKVAERASLEGGFNATAEAKAVASVITRGMDDAVKTLKTGRSDLDVLYGKGGRIRESDVAPQTMIDMFGHIHGMLKAPVKRAAFERYLEKELAWQAKQGSDITDPMIQTQAMIEAVKAADISHPEPTVAEAARHKAYKYAQRSIFMQDNVLTDTFQAVISRLTKADPKTGEVSSSGKIGATVARVIFPIVKVPTNIVGEILETATGSATGSYKLAKALRAGLENLKPEEADVIMRQLKKGSLGAAALALGYYNADSVGGYYQPGEKRKVGDVKAGTIRVFGHDIPSVLMHNPIMEVMQLGATVRRVADSKTKGANRGTMDGIGQALLGLSEAVPFIKTPVDLAKIYGNPSESEKAKGEFVKGLVVPALLDQASRWTDRDEQGNPIARDPKTVTEHIESGIPGLRQNVRRKIKIR